MCFPALGWKLRLVQWMRDTAASPQPRAKVKTRAGEWDHHHSLPQILCEWELPAFQAWKKKKKGNLSWIIKPTIYVTDSWNWDQELVSWHLIRLHSVMAERNFYDSYFSWPMAKSLLTDWPNVKYARRVSWCFQSICKSHYFSNSLSRLLLYLLFSHSLCGFWECSLPKTPFQGIYIAIRDIFLEI